MNFEEFKKKYQKAPIENIPNEVLSNPLVSVCVITYQHKKYIEECLNSVLNQKVSFKYEILLFEDESSDGTKELCIKYAQMFPDKIRLFLNDRRNNIFVNGNPTGRFGVLYNFYSANGKYIAMCEGDDYWSNPLKLERQVEFLERNSQFAGAFHETQLTNGSKITGRIYGSEILDVFLAPDSFATSAPFHTSSFVFRKPIIEDFPAWFFKIVSSDMALFSIIAAQGPLKKIAGVMSVYRKHEGGITNSEALISGFHKNRIELMQLLNKYHQYVFKDKAMKVIKFHKSKLPKTNLSRMFNRIKKRLSCLFKANSF